MSIYNPEPRLFLTNKFTHTYYFVVSKAQSMNRSKLHPSNSKFVYYESHHIVPSSLGGSNDIINLVLLTAYEHYLCHWLLTKMCVSQNHVLKMLFPLRCMTNKTKLEYLQNLAKCYESSKADIAKASSLLNSGRKHSEKTRKKHSLLKSGSGNHMFDKKHSEDTLELMREAKRGSKNPNYGGLTDNHKRKISEAQIGKEISEATKAKQRKTYLVTFPDGRQVTTSDRLKFCLEHNLSGANFSCAAASGKPYKGYLIRVNRA